jgi:3-deoxy-D-manno-octulosonate 8-phosphate phosphatase (KDO 8-P phosphatase)
MSDSASALPDRERARRVRLVIFDVDGVLTDGGVYLGGTAAGEKVEMKRFEITDGLGIRFLDRAGLLVAIVTGRVSEAVRLRAEELKIVECHQDRSASKLPVVRDLLERTGISWEETAFLADDLVDLPVLRRVGFPAAVANAVAEVKEIAIWTGNRAGGSGAAREFAEALLRARGEWEETVAEYLREKDDEEP